MTRTESVSLRVGSVRVGAGNWLIEVNHMQQEQEMQSGQWVVTSESATGEISYYTFNETASLFRDVRLPSVQPAPTARQTAAP